MNLETSVNKSLANLTPSDFLHIGYGYTEYNKRMGHLSLNPNYSELLPGIRRNKMILGIFHSTAVLITGYFLYNLQ